MHSEPIQVTEAINRPPGYIVRSCDQGHSASDQSEPSIHLQALEALSACWREGAAAPADVVLPPGLVADRLTLDHCGAVVSGAIHRQLQGADVGEVVDDFLAAIQALLGQTDVWLEGQPDRPVPAPLDPPTLRFCGTVVRESLFGLLEEIVQELEELPEESRGAAAPAAAPAGGKEA